MEYTIRVEPAGQVFTCGEKQTLLSAAIQANILMPYSCRGGRCGTCRGRVESGTYDYLNGMPEAINEQEAQEGWALFCSARPSSDMTIRVMPRRL